MLRKVATCPGVLAEKNCSLPINIKDYGKGRLLLSGHKGYVAGRSPVQDMTCKFLVLLFPRSVLPHIMIKGKGRSFQLSLLVWIPTAYKSVMWHLDFCINIPSDVRGQVPARLDICGGHIFWLKKSRYMTQDKSFESGTLPENQGMELWIHLTFYLM